jgi:hypothetical protein
VLLEISNRHAFSEEAYQVKLDVMRALESFFKQRFPNRMLLHIGLNDEVKRPFMSRLWTDSMCGFNLDCLLMVDDDPATASPSPASSDESLSAFITEKDTCLDYCSGDDNATTIAEEGKL